MTYSGSFILTNMESMMAKKCYLPKQAEKRVVSRPHDALVKDNPLLVKCDSSSGSSFAKIYLTF